MHWVIVYVYLRESHFASPKAMMKTVSTICVLVRRGDVLSCWTGLRPLVMDPNKADTQSLARNHIIEVGKDNLITIAGK